MHRLVLISILAPLLCGCARTEHIPQYQWTNSQAALSDLAARARAVRSVSAQCDITLTRTDGQSVRLDGAVVMKPPTSVRLRAWKMGQAVFDLTLNADGAWIVMPDDPNQKDRVLPAGASAAKFAHGWAGLSGEFFLADDAKVIDSGGPRFQVIRTIDGQLVTCEVDRSTLTVRRYAIADSAGTKHFTLTEDQYEMIGGIPWPTHLVAQSERGTIEIHLHDVELNAELPSGALIPPARAQKLP
ncbi:MAG TPA: hypothetical protein VH370_03865 [Humisphaera sp.]|jgi:hypothetical protein|nr:hypothetical protein [Humisphaera sp.]